MIACLTLSCLTIILFGSKLKFFSKVKLSVKAGGSATSCAVPSTRKFNEYKFAPSTRKMLHMHCMYGCHRGKIISEKVLNYNERHQRRRRLSLVLGRKLQDKIRDCDGLLTLMELRVQVGLSFKEGSSWSAWD